MIGAVAAFARRFRQGFRRGWREAYGDKRDYQGMTFDELWSEPSRFAVAAGDMHVFEPPYGPTHPGAAAIDAADMEPGSGTLPSASPRPPTARSEGDPT